MEISEKKQTELYKAIADPIMDARIEYAKTKKGEDLLQKLEHQIWRRVHKALNLNSIP